MKKRIVLLGPVAGLALLASQAPSAVFAWKCESGFSDTQANRDSGKCVAVENHTEAPAAPVVSVPVVQAPVEQSTVVSVAVPTSNAAPAASVPFVAHDNPLQPYCHLEYDQAHQPVYVIRFTRDTTPSRMGELPIAPGQCDQHQAAVVTRALPASVSVSAAPSVTEAQGLPSQAVEVAQVVDTSSVAVSQPQAEVAESAPEDQVETPGGLPFTGDPNAAAYCADPDPEWLAGTADPVTGLTVCDVLDQPVYHGTMIVSVATGPVRLCNQADTPDHDVTCAWYWLSAGQQARVDWSKPVEWGDDNHELRRIN